MTSYVGSNQNGIPLNQMMTAVKAIIKIILSQSLDVTPRIISTPPMKDNGKTSQPSGFT